MKRSTFQDICPPQSDLLTAAETEKGNGRKASFGADVGYIDRFAAYLAKIVKNIRLNLFLVCILEAPCLLC